MSDKSGKSGKSGKSILDTVADEANKAFEHASELLKSGQHSAAHEAISMGIHLSTHASEIEDHDDRMGRNDAETHPTGVVINIDGSDIAKATDAGKDIS